MVIYRFSPGNSEPADVQMAWGVDARQMIPGQGCGCSRIWTVQGLHIVSLLADHCIPDLRRNKRAAVLQSQEWLAQRLDDFL